MATKRVKVYKVAGELAERLRAFQRDKTNDPLYLLDLGKLLHTFRRLIEYEAAKVADAERKRVATPRKQGGQESRKS